MAQLKNTTVNDTGFVALPSGTTAQRQNAEGAIRYNTSNNEIEFYDGSGWQTFLGDVEVPIPPNPRYGFGTLSAQNINGTVNSYSHMTSSSVSAGSTTITVASASGMSVGDKAMIHQTQAYSPSSDAGNYDIVTINAINGNTLSFSPALTYTYTSGRYDRTDQTAQVTQVVTCPQYSTVTLNGLVEAKVWDGQSGGIVFITATNSINSNGNYISAWGKGYRGGRGTGGPGTQSSGFAGESIRGHFNDEDNPNDTGGGGGDGDANAGGDSGASGGHATAGGPGEDGSGGDPQGGGTIGSAAMTQIFFGGAGGRGGDNDSHSFVNFMNPDTGADNIDGSSNWNSFFAQYTSYDPPWGSQRYSSGPDQPANGGGIVVLASPSIPNLNTTVRGSTSVGTGTSGEKNGSGAAGSIYIVTENNGLSINNAFAQGNAAGSMDGDPIGESGDGRIRVDINGGTSYSGSFTRDSGSLQVNNA